jgi:integrase
MKVEGIMKSDTKKEVKHYRKRTKYQGVYERESDVKIFKGHPDLCFDIAYRTNGRLIWEKAGWLSEGYSAKLASDIRAGRIQNIRHGQELPRQKNKVPYFKDLAIKFLEWAKQNKRSWETDNFRYKKHLSCFDEKRLNEISSFDLERLKIELTKKGLSPASVKHVLILFRHMWNKAVTWKTHSGENPIKNIKLPTLQNQRERFLSYQEADELLNVLSKKDKQLHDIVLLSLHTGMRFGEIANLKRQNLDFENELITIMDPKNNETRKSFMTNAVRQALSGYSNLSPWDYVFKKDGKKLEVVPYPYRTIANKLFNEGIEDPRQKITFHTLRHSFASWLALQNESLLTIGELLGHKTFQVTKRYAHLIPDHKKEATLNLEKVFNTKKQNNGIKVSA